MNRLLAIVLFALMPAGVSSQELLFPSSQWEEKNLSIEQAIGVQWESLLAGSARFRPLGDLSRTHPPRQLSAPVGRLRIMLSSGKFATCTATLIASDLIITNHHCIPGRGASGKVRQAKLELGYYEVGPSNDFRTYSVRASPIASSSEMDFSVLRVDGRPGDKYGWARINLRAPTQGEELRIVHHPGGDIKQVSENCSAGPITSRRTAQFGHKCDTLPGSSGAPIFASDNTLIGVHCCGAVLVGNNSFNYGKSIQIINDSHRIFASRQPSALPGNGNRPSSGRNVDPDDCIDFSDPDWFVKIENMGKQDCR